MKPTGFCLICLALIAFAAAQSEDELHIPMENDNQFPPDNNLESDGSILEESEVGAIDVPIDIMFIAEPSPLSPAKDAQLPITENNESNAENSEVSMRNLQNYDLTEIQPGTEVGATEDTIDITIATESISSPPLEDAKLPIIENNESITQNTENSSLNIPNDEFTETQEESDIGPTEEPIDITTATESISSPPLEDAQLPIIENNESITENTENSSLNMPNDELTEIQLVSEVGGVEESIDITTTTESSPPPPLLEDVHLPIIENNELTEIQLSEVGAIEKTIDITNATESSSSPPLENVQLPIIENSVPIAENSEDSSLNIPNDELTEIQLVSKVGGVEESIDITITTESTPPPSPLEDVHLPILENNEFTEIQLSEVGAIEKTIDITNATESSSLPTLEDVQLPIIENNVPIAENSEDSLLNIQNNELTEIQPGSEIDATQETTDITTATESSSFTPLEHVQLPIIENNVPIAENSEDSSCPKPCVCHIEEDANNFVVDCSGYNLTEFPTSIDTKATTLNIQNNKLTEIPKEISSLKNLKALNAANNYIMDLDPGSISELPDLTVLMLGNNRLIEYPKDLKNGSGLTKLEELDLGGNDMRTPLNSDIFSHFKALRKLTLPTATSELVEDLCHSLKESLDTVCTESCSTQIFECSDASQSLTDDLLDVVLPGTISFNPATDDNSDPTRSEDTKIDQNKTDSLVVSSEGPADVGSNVTSVASETNVENDFSLRSAVNKAPDGISSISTSVGSPEETTNDQKEANVAVGATTSDTKTGGVDKSVIGMIVAGMVLVVAGITIKKNWSSIKNRFSSSPRAANERSGANSNGTAPEEVPLQEKFPV